MCQNDGHGGAFDSDCFDAACDDSDADDLIDDVDAACDGNVSCADD